MTNGKIPTIVAILILVGALVAGVLLLQYRQVYRLGAEPQETPKDVRITNITDAAFTVTWTTDKPIGGFVKWGTGAGNLDQVAIEELANPGTVHSTTITTGQSGGNYFFKINSGADYDNNGAPWQVQTGAKLPPPASSNIISGTVLTAAGQPAANVLVYVNVAGASGLSTLTSESGSWVIPISEARTQDLSGYTPINNSTTLVIISVQAGAGAGPAETATAQIYPVGARPAPPIILGQTHDFRNRTAEEFGDSPQANLEAPETTPASGFQVPELPGSTPTTVTLKSLSEGEVVTSTNPEFFGDGPPGTAITITVESDPITDQTAVGTDGTWKWNPPQNLPEGTHTITLSWRDAGGVLRTLKRTFIVQAAGGPAFVATPSATPTNTPTPSPTASPTATPRATVTPTASVSATPTRPPIPESGSLTTTLFLSMLGGGSLLLSGLFAYLAIKKT